MIAEPVRVLVIDDDYYVREAITALITRDVRTRLWGVSRSVSEAAASLADQAAAPSPDVILLDVRLAEGDRAGIEKAAGVVKLHLFGMDAELPECMVDLLRDGPKRYGLRPGHKQE